MILINIVRVENVQKLLIKKTNGVDQRIHSDLAIMVMSEMTEIGRIDLGHSFVVRGSHPSLGKVIIYNSAEGSSAISFI